jgi:hypothetical protein
VYKIIPDIEHQAKNIHRLEFELSNNCQYANKHKWCPLSRDERGPVFLAASIVRKVVDFFQQYDFYGIVYLSGYGEPLLDPRLIDLIKYIKEHLPRARIFMFSNGVSCDEHLLADVIQAGVEVLKLSVYDKKEHVRLAPIADKVPGVMLRSRVLGPGDDDIDGRINIYDEQTNGVGGPCYMPTLFYFVRNNGDANMCNWDWKCTQTFGNLYNDSVEDTLMNERRLEINCELVNGNLSVLPVCSS